jgi:predicted permease
MAVVGEWLRRIWYLLNRSRFDEQLKQEMTAHRSMMGEPARFGNTLRLREDAQDVWGWRWLDDIGRDLRFAARTLRRTPGFSLVVIISLALASGATTSIFSILNGVLLRPLPFDEPDRLVHVYGRNWREDRGGVPDPLTGRVAAPELLQFQRNSTSFAGFSAYDVTTRHLAGPAGPERVTAVVGDLEFFTVLGAKPMIGRTFDSDDPQDVAVVSARLWRQQFAGEPSLSERTITLDEQRYTVVGVMADSFQFPYAAASLMPGALPETRTDVWLPLPPLRDAGAVDQRRGRYNVIARLKPQVTIEAASSELKAIAQRVEEPYTGTRVRVGVRLDTVADVVVQPIRRSLWMLFAAVGLVLAAACANVANLLLARTTVRAREVVTRAALGAGRSRLVRQFLAESLLLSLAGGMLGTAVAAWGTRVLVVAGAARIPRAHEIALDWQMFAFLLALCLVTAALFGIAPALMASRIDLMTVTAKSAGDVPMARSFARMRDVLVMLEVAMAFLLVLGAAIVMREIARLHNVESGMSTSNVVSLHLSPRASASDYYAIEERVRHMPGVQSAGFTQLIPLQNWGWLADFAIAGRVSEGRPTAGLRYVTPGYFETLGIPVLKGRSFTLSDAADSPRVILINNALARQYFPNEDPVGRALDRGTIIGVVRDVHQVHLGAPPEPEIYYPAAQNVTMASDLGMSLLIRTDGPPDVMVAPVRTAVREINPNLAIFNVKTMDQVVSDSLWELRLYRWLVGLFAILAVVLATIGLYGVMAYNVAARTREFAVRLALGSEPARLARLVIARALGVTAVGVAGGVLAAMTLMVLFSQNQAIAGTGVEVYAGIVLLFLAIAAIACAIPAIRLASVNPASALRSE